MILMYPEVCESQAKFLSSTKFKQKEAETVIELPTCTLNEPRGLREFVYLLSCLRVSFFLITFPQYFILKMFKYTEELK